MKRRIISVLLAVMLAAASITFSSGCFESEYPVVVAGINIETRPQKVVCLSTLYTEIIVEIGKLDTLVGRPFDCELSAVKDITAVGTSDAPSVDAIEEIAPDLIIADNRTPAETVQQLIDDGYNVLFMTVATDRLSLRNQYACIGAAMNGAVKGQADGISAAESILIRLDDIERLVMGEDTQNVCIFTSLGLSSYITGDNIATMCIDLAGGFNVASEGVNGSFLLDNVARSDPDVILCPDGAVANVRSRRSLQKCSALINNRIYVFDPAKFDSLGSQLIIATWEIARVLHPDIITANMLPAGATDYYVGNTEVMTGEEYQQMLQQAQEEAEQAEREALEALTGGGE